MLGVNSDEEPTSSEEGWEASSDRPSDNFPHEGNTEEANLGDGEDEEGSNGKAASPNLQPEQRRRKKTEKELRKEQYRRDIAHAKRASLREYQRTDEEIKRRKETSAHTTGHADNDDRQVTEVTVTGEDLLPAKRRKALLPTSSESELEDGEIPEEGEIRRLRHLYR